MEVRGDIVKNMRLSRNWTQHQLAEICDINLRTIQRVEKQGNASLETIMAICVAFDVQREALFEVPKPQGGEENMVKVTRFPVFVLGMFFGAIVTALLTKLV